MRGYLWNAVVGWRLHVRVAPNGQVDRVIDLPTPEYRLLSAGGPEHPLRDDGSIASRWWGPPVWQPIRYPNRSSRCAGRPLSSGRLKGRKRFFGLTASIHWL